MIIKKLGVFIGTVGLITALMIGCGSSDTSHDDIENEGFTGTTFSFILEGLANGMLSYATGDVMGNFLSLLGWGDSGSSEEEQTLKNINKTLTAISGELKTIESTLLEIIKEIDIEEHEIKNDVDWPRDAIDFIKTAHQDLNSSAYYYDLNGTLHRYKPGEGNQTAIRKLASTFLDTYILKDRVTSISDAIEGNPTPLLSNYIAEVIDKLHYNDDRLQEQYKGFETYTSQLLNYQIMGVNEVIEATKILDGNSSAEIYLNEIYMPMLIEEVDNIDSPSSFIYNAVSLVLKNAPLYGQFLPTSAESILKRAEFYRLLVTGTDDDKFGLRLFHISTADRPAAPDYLLASKDGAHFHACYASRHKVEGRPYDQWDGNNVDSNTTYRVVKYACDSLPEYSMPVGTYGIYTFDTSGKVLLTTAEVANYDSNYTKKDDGNISYGLGLMQDYIDNRFTESWGHWSQQKHSDVNSKISGSANDWPIEIYFKRDDNTYTTTTSGSTELDGHFHYSGSTDKKITIDYYVKFYLKASAQKVYLGNQPYASAAYRTGVWDSTEGKIECDYEHSLNAGSGHSYSEYRYPKHTCTFTAQPGHHYYVYFKMFIKGDQTDDGWDITAVSKLEKVYRVYVKFEE